MGEGGEGVGVGVVIYSAKCTYSAIHIVHADVCACREIERYVQACEVLHRQVCSVVDRPVVLNELNQCHFLGG